MYVSIVENELYKNLNSHIQAGLVSDRLWYVTNKMREYTSTVEKEILIKMRHTFSELQKVAV